MDLKYIFDRGFAAVQVSAARFMDSQYISDRGFAAVQVGESVSSGEEPGPVQVFAVTLGWVAPVENTDGTLLTDLAGFKIFRDGEWVVTIQNPYVLAYVDSDLLAGRYCYVASAYTYAGLESDFSNQSCRVTGQ